MNGESWGSPDDYFVGQNVARPCDRCGKLVGRIGGCYAKQQDHHLCFECFDEVFDRQTQKEKAGWDA